jgi:KaiC/GvpD/RAD55 family RecA-like ATPase
MEKRSWVWILAITFSMLVFGSNTGAASALSALYGESPKIPLFIYLFILINIFQLTMATAMVLEVKKVSRSPVWDSINKANIFDIFHVIGLTILLYRLYPKANVTTLILISALCTHAILMVNVTEYFLIKPIIKTKISFFKLRYIVCYLTLPTISYFLVKYFFHLLTFMDFPYYEFSYFFMFLFISVVILFLYDFLSLSKVYAPIGFVSKPFFFATVGVFSLFVYSAIVFYINHDLHAQYYFIVLWIIPNIMGVSYYLKFAIDYPSLIQSRWKSLMPFDLPKVTAAFTLTLLALSLYLTTREYPSLVLNWRVPYLIPFIFLISIFLGTVLTFTYLSSIFERTRLRYWEYLRRGLQLHLAVTLYVLCLLFLLWNDASSNTKLLVLLFCFFSVAFYLAFALDLRTLLKDQNIMPNFVLIDIVLYLVFFCTFFALIYFCVIGTHGIEPVLMNLNFVSYPSILFFIAFFLIVFGAYLSITHKGFEEILGKNIWSELSYICAFIVFILLYLLYSSLETQLKQFPYHSFAFIGYFSVLLIEILSTASLGGKIKFTNETKGDIVDLLNYHVQNFLRTDYLEDLWKTTVYRFITEEDRQKIDFDAAQRKFDIDDLDEKTKRTLAVSMLLQMHKLSEGEKIAIQRKSLGEAKGEIVEILREKILQLPEELRAEFDEDLYYPLLLEKSINDLLTHLRTFISASEHEVIFEGLKRRDEVFACVDFETEEIHVREGTRFGRDKFLELFKLYLDAVGDKFPFKRCLLRGLVKEEIRTDAHAPIAASEVFDIISTGIKELNLVMAGGLVKGSSTLLITEETKAKQRILHSLITRNLPEGMSILYATSKRPYQQIQGELLMELDSVDRVTMLDLYAPLYEEKGVSELVEYDHRILVPLSKILFQRSFVKAIKSQPRNQPRLVIIDVYDDFAKYYQPEEIYELLQTQVEGLKRWDCTTILVLDPHSHLLKKVGVDEVKKNFENILVLAGAEKETVVQIEKLFHGTPGKRVVPLEW